MDIIEAGGKVAKALTPPRNDADPKLVFRWRVMLALAVGGGLIVQLLNNLLIWGWIPIFGFTGFAANADVIDLQTKTAELQMQQMHVEDLIRDGNNQTMATVVSGQIFQVRDSQCKALKEGNLDAGRAYGQQLQDKLLEYRNYTGGRDYPLSACP